MSARRQFTIEIPHHNDWLNAPESYRSAWAAIFAKETCGHKHFVSHDTIGDRETVAFDGPMECEYGRALEHACMVANMEENR